MPTATLPPKKSPREAQTDTILRHLKTKKSITAGEAMMVHNIYRLAARICDLRAAGYLIETVMHADPNGKKYARYRLA